MKPHARAKGRRGGNRAAMVRATSPGTRPPRPMAEAEAGKATEAA